MEVMRICDDATGEFVMRRGDMALDREFETVLSPVVGDVYRSLAAGRRGEFSFWRRLGPCTTDHISV